MALCLAVMVLCTPLVAQTLWTNPGTGDWFTPANWSLGVPTSGTTGRLNNGGTAQILSGSAESSVFHLGYSSGESGTVTVRNSGSSWTNSGHLYVGESGTGTLNIENGGTVSNGDCYLGNQSGSTGTATVKGANSMWMNNSSLFVGSSGTGILNIEDGGKVTYEIGYLGISGVSSGTATVKGANSMWTNNSSLLVGFIGTGTLNIEDGGIVNVNAGAGVLELGFFSGSIGTLSIGNGAAAGVLNAASVNGDSGTAVLNFNHTDADYFFTKDGTSAGAAVLITGSTRVNLLGSGKTTLTGGNTYTGGTTINAGVLQVSQDANLGDALGALLFNGGTLRTTAGFTMNRATTLNAGGGTFDVSAGVLTQQGVITGPGSLTKLGAGTLALTGNNHYSGGTNLNDGTLLVGDDFALGTGALTLGDGTTFGVVSGESVILDNNVTVDGDVNISVDFWNFLEINGAVDLGGATRTLTFTEEESDVVFTGVISGTGGLNLVMSGSGMQSQVTFIGSDSNTYMGLTTVGQGVVLSLAKDPVYMAIAGDLQVDVGGALQLFDTSEQINPASTLTINGFLGIVAQSGTTTQSIGNLQGTGVIVNMFGPSIITVNSGSFGGQILDSDAEPLALVKSGTGTLILSGANAYRGGTTISGGILQIGDGGTTGSIDGDVSNNATLVFNRSDDSSFGGVISGTGVVTKLGAGTLNLTGNNTYTGGTTISAGALQIGNGGTTGSIAGDVSNNAALVFNRSDGSSFGGVISGTGVVTKLGAGALSLTGNNSYTGGTTISAGTLRINNTTGSGTGTGSVFVQNGGTLAGSGFISGAVSLASGGRIAPGNSPGVLTVGSLDLGGGSLLDFELGTSSDRIDITGLLTNSGGGLRTFNFSDAGGFALGTSYTLLTFDSSLNVLVGDFTGNSLLGGDPAFELLSNALLVTFFSTVFDGPTIQNSAPVGTSPFANFVVNGPVVTGGPGESNTVRSLTFNPGSSLQVFNNLTVTNGNFTVNSGRAAINGGRVIVPGDFNKNGGGTLVLNTFLQAGGDAIIHGGSLQVNGLLQLGGVASIQGGSLIVNGTLTADGVNVGRGGLLKGSGVIFGDVLNAGTVAPGNSPGTLTIIGNYTQTGIGTLQIEIASEKVFDRLIVSGTARLDGTLDIRNYHGNTLSYGQQVPFLQAGRIVGTFDEILMPEEDLFRGRFLNAGHTGILLVAPTSYTLVAETPNQTRVAHALDRWIGIEEGDIGGVTLALDLLTAEQYPAAFEAIMPGYYESVLSTGIELSQSQGQLLFQQLSSRRLGARTVQPVTTPVPISAKGAKNVAPVQPQVAIAEGTPWNGWMQGSGLFSDGGLSLNPGEDFDSGTFMVGADFAVSEHASLGLFASYQEGWGDYDNGGNMDLESVRFGGYATFDFDGFYASAAVGGGTTDYSVERPIQWATLDRTARSDPDGAEFFTLLGTGYDFHAGNFTFGPSLSAQYTKLKLDEFTESGSDTLDLRIRDAEEESLRTYLGGRIAYTVKVNDRFTVIPELRAFWEHEFLQGGENLNASLNGGSGPEFTYVTEEPGKDAMYVGAGLNFEFGENLTTSVYYHANFGRNDDAQHTVSVSANWTF